MSLTWGRVIGQCVLAGVVVAGCSGGGSLPDGRQELKQAAAAMREVRSVGFAIRSEGKPSISVKSADGRLLRSGDAEGTLQLDQSGQSVEMAFTLVGDTVYFKGATGGYQQLPKATVLAVYDPSAILDPQRGIVKLLDTAGEPETDEREKVNGQQALRIKAKLSKSVVPALVPGVAKDVDGQVWVAESDHRVLKVRMPLEGGAVTVTFADFNRNFVITAPKG
ncbi:MAG TPA: LppX_LprAFG lipoprotein [Streptosporangiaceae bacterium]|nr:LppX_LprAFG lipoprotein [Streptosporangiaceae bacterium]